MSPDIQVIRSKKGRYLVIQSRVDLSGPVYRSIISTIAAVPGVNIVKEMGRYKAVVEAGVLFSVEEVEERVVRFLKHFAEAHELNLEEGLFGV